MSEQQVLPPRPKPRFNEWRQHEIVSQSFNSTDAQTYMDALEAFLAQSEAERERLQGENVKLLNDASVWRNRAIGAEEEIREGGRGIDLRRGFER